jgi:hypothetical protein
MRDTPPCVEKTTTYVPESSIKNRAKEIKEPAVSQQAKKKGKKLKFSPEVVKIPSKPLTTSIEKGMYAMHTSQEPSEAPEAFTETSLVDDKDNFINELQEQLKKAHFVIAQVKHKNREMKKKYLEQSFNKYTLVEGERSMYLNPTDSKEKGKWKAVELSSEVEEIPRPRIPFTRSSTRKLHSQKGTPAKDQPTTKDNKSTSTGEGKYTKHMREAQNVIIQLREENR